MAFLARKDLSLQLPPEQQASSELAKRILELRVTGMAGETEAWQGAILNNLSGAPRCHATVAQTTPSEGLLATRKATIERNIAELVRAFPLAFSTGQEQTKPLGIGIKQRIYARSTLSHRKVSAALRRYTGRLAYQYAIIDGAVRVDLDGKASGRVTVKEATHAAEQIKKIIAKAAGTPKDTIKPNAPLQGNIPRRPTISNALKSGPRRLGLGNLKQAAATRRGPGATAPDV
jgi:hypothetical protein